MKRIAISGSNGKSTTTLWTAAAVAACDVPVACVWSGGDTFRGKPVHTEHSTAGFLQFDAKVEKEGAAALVVEVVSRALGRRFADLWRYDVAVLTNVTHEHHDDHGSMEAYHQAKARLFDGLRPGGIAVFTATDRLAVEIVQKARPDIHRRGYRLIGREAFAEASLHASIQEMTWDQTRLSVESRAADAGTRLTAPAPGEHFAENAIAAWLAATSAGFRSGVCSRWHRIGSASFKQVRNSCPLPHAGHRLRAQSRCPGAYSGGCPPAVRRQGRTRLRRSRSDGPTEAPSNGGRLMRR